MEPFTLTINTDNDAFADTPEVEVARILRNLAGHVLAMGGPTSGRLHDINGNTVGQFNWPAS